MRQCLLHFSALCALLNLTEACWANGFVGDTYRLLSIGAPGKNYLGAVDDAELIRQSLLSGSTLQAANAEVLAAPKTVQAVDDKIEATIAKAGGNDVSILYFSAHGAHLNERTIGGAIKRHEVVIVNEAGWGSPPDPQSFMKKETLKESLDGVGGVAIVILDACYSAALNPSRPNTIFIASAGRNEGATAESAVLKHYLFTYYLGQALTVDRTNDGFLAADVNKDRKVTVQEWFNRAAAATQNYILEENASAHKNEDRVPDQTPVLDDSTMPNGRKAQDVVIFIYQPGVVITLAPEVGTVSVGASLWFKAEVRGHANRGVIWALNPPIGILDQITTEAGAVHIRYRPPPNPTNGQTVTVIATSTADATKSARATVTLQTAAGLRLAESNGEAPPPRPPLTISSCKVLVNAFLQATPPVQACPADNQMVFYLTTRCGEDRGVDFTNVSHLRAAGPKMIWSPHLEVVILNGPCCPCKIKETGGGLGSLIVPSSTGHLYDDLLDPREWFNQHIGVVVTNRKPFSFWVDVWGYVATVPAPNVSIASVNNR